MIEISQHYSSLSEQQEKAHIFYKTREITEHMKYKSIVEKNRCLKMISACRIYQSLMFFKRNEMIRCNTVWRYARLNFKEAYHIAKEAQIEKQIITFC